jgi:hypothetical protein
VQREAAPEPGKGFVCHRLFVADAAIKSFHFLTDRDYNDATQAVVDELLATPARERLELEALRRLAALQSQLEQVTRSVCVCERERERERDCNIKRDSG